jgi:hypothetical protein
MHTFDNIVLFPFRLLWNILVTGLLIGGFVLWWGFLFGSVIAVVIVLIFMPELFMLPIAIMAMYTPIWPED